MSSAENPPQTVSGSPLPSPAPGTMVKVRFISSAWFYPLLACFILLILFSFRKIESYDLGTHLRAGSWIVQNHSFPDKDAFTYTQNDRDYLDSNGLYQIVLYLLQSSLGYPALTLLNMILLLGVFGILLWRLRLAGTSSGWTCLWLLAAIFITERRFIVRPEVFSWLFLGLTLLILEYRQKNRNFLFCLPLIQLAWVNIEGLFILGWIALFAYGATGYFQKRPDKELLKYGFLSLVADLVNPYFLKGVFFPFALAARLWSSDPHKQNITELYSPWRFLTASKLHYDSNLYLFLFLFVFFTGSFLLAASWKKRSFHEILLAALFGLLALSAVRNIPLFILAASPYFAQSLSPWLRGRDEALFKRKEVPFVLLSLILLFSCRIATNAYYLSDRRVERFGWGLGSGILPLDAVQFLRENKLDGRILNSIDCGGWVDWQAPQPSFIDGRSELFSDDFYSDYSQSFQPGGLLPLLVRYQPQLILVDYKAASPWVDQLLRNPVWRLIYLDSCGALYAHDGYAPQFPSLNLSSLLASYGISFQTEEDMTQHLSQAEYRPFQDWMKGFYHPPVYPENLISLGLFSLKYGQYPLARALFYGALQSADGEYEEIYLNLAISNLNLGKFALGKICLQDTLQINPSNPSALRMFSKISN